MSHPKCFIPSSFNLSSEKWLPDANIYPSTMARYVQIQDIIPSPVPVSLVQVILAFSEVTLFDLTAVCISPFFASSFLLLLTPSDNDQGRLLWSGFELGTYKYVLQLNSPRTRQSIDLMSQRIRNIRHPRHVHMQKKKTCFHRLLQTAIMGIYDI